jgi:hypothetical protein
VSTDELTRLQRLGLHAGLTLATLLGELVVLALLLAAALGASAALEPNATAANAQPRIELACEIGFWTLPILVGLVAAWRRFWVVTGVQICLLLWMDFALLLARLPSSLDNVCGLNCGLITDLDTPRSASCCFAVSREP